MPSTSAKQKRLMDAAAHNPEFAAQVGVPVKVAKEFSESSKGMKFGSGAPKSRADLQKINRPDTRHGKSEFFAKGGNVAKKLFGGKETFKEELAEAKAIKSGKITPEQYARGERSEGVHGMKKMASGGITKAKMGKVTAGGTRPHGEHSVQTKGHTKGKEVKMTGGKPLGMKKGGRCG